MRKWLASLALAALCVACSPGTPDEASPPPTGRQTTATAERSPSEQPSPSASLPETTRPETPRPSTSRPAPTPTISLPPGMQVPDFFDKNGKFDIEKFQRWLKEQQKGGMRNGNGEDCSPLSPTCLYDPLWGSCEWDPWRGLYVCNGPFYREGYDCYLDLWWDQYICRPPG